MNQNELTSKNYKKVYTTLIYFEHFIVLASGVAGCVSISDFASLIGIPVGNASSAIELKTCTITAGIKN